MPSSHLNNPPPTPSAQLQAIRLMRAKFQAPVDTLGCHQLASQCPDPPLRRFQTLIALMLSPQTKDAVTAQAFHSLFARFPTAHLLATEGTPTEIDTLISKVGFHTCKALNIHRVACTCTNEYAGDIPHSVAQLVALPGVGPKIAHLTMGAAWGECTGIGVDLHVLRIANRLGWCKARGAEQCRRQLEGVFERALWPDVNWLLVGFGQVVCKARGPLCSRCTLIECPSRVVDRLDR